MNWTLIAAVNNKQVLRNCLLRSPGLQTASDILLQGGYSSAATAYNSGIAKSKTDLLVFAHQDVYFPQNWIAAVDHSIQVLSKSDPNWGVLGVWGVKPNNNRFGWLYCRGAGKTLGSAFEGGEEVQSLDEVVLILRKSSGLRFDDKLAGFHFYGADICLEARRRGMKSYAISAFCLHNTRGYGMLPLAFWKSYLDMRKKWKAELPIRTPCTKITYGCWPMIRWNVVRAINLATGRDKPPRQPVQDPSRLYQSLVDSGDVPSPVLVH